jgi:hypothetical protein
MTPQSLALINYTLILALLVFIMWVYWGRSIRLFITQFWRPSPKANAIWIGISKDRETAKLVMTVNDMQIGWLTFNKSLLGELIRNLQIYESDMIDRQPANIIQLPVVRRPPQ